MADDLAQRLEAARTRERAARARTARLRRSLDRSNRKTQSQIKFTLGAAMVALAESGKGEQLVTNFRRWLDRYLARDIDRRILRDTPFSVETKEEAHAS
ncbi:hypothetical protein [Mesorhizobium sp. YR577]|uniref:hypothetical protein n=1 Tax=Mesorhizobium sp. YR577 TaxID=1884373 RepID=UPI0008EEB2BD|nr:hypothetical protein [Mesorhizobium sp. YR577]SFU09637.1 hypothetical protein SAMN05518861_112152 [Mesorhizobium sp. YR577]